MKKYNIAVLGATGAVGQEMLNILAEYDIPVNKLLPLASARSAGGTVKFRAQWANYGLPALVFAVRARCPALR